MLIGLVLVADLRGNVNLDSIFQIPHPNRIRVLDHVCAVQLGTVPYKERIASYEVLKQKAHQFGDEASEKLLEALAIGTKLQHDTLDLANKLKRFRDLALQSRLLEHKVLEIHILTMLADTYRELGRIGSSITYCYKVYNLIELVHVSLLPRQKDIVVWDLAYAMYRIGDYERTRTFIENSDQLHKHNHTGMLLCDLLSQVCWRLKDYSCARASIQKGLNVYMNSDTTSWFFSGWRGIFLGNLAKIKWSEQQYHLAIPELVEAIRLVSAAKMQDNVNTFGLILSDSYLRSGMPILASRILGDIQNSILAKGNTEQKIDLYKLKMIANQSSQHTTQLLNWMDSLDYFKSKLSGDLLLNQQARNEYESELNEYLLVEQEMHKKIQSQVILRNILLGFVLFLLLAGVFIVFKKQKQIFIEKKRAEEIIIRSSEELKRANEELQAFKEQLVERNIQLEIAERSHSINEDHSMLENIKRSPLLTDEAWMEFRKIFDKVHSGYRRKIKEQIPGLTPAEERYLVLIKLDLGVKEIAAALGVGPGAVRTLKSRLMSKVKNLDLQRMEINL